MTPASLVIGILTGAIGLAYFVYGKRQAKFVPLITGVLLCIYPYFVSSIAAMLAIGALLVAAPFLIDF